MFHFAQANQIKKVFGAFDRAAFAGRIEGLIERFTPEFLAAHAAHASPSELPTPILGLPRSGTSLVEQILSSHRDVAGAGELQFWPTLGPLFDALSGDACRRLPDPRGPRLPDGPWGSRAGDLPRRRQEPRFQLHASSGLNSPGLPARHHHPLPARSDRHLPVDPGDLFRAQTGLFHRPGRPGVLLAPILASDGSLASDTASRTVRRGRLRDSGRRSGARFASPGRCLRPGLGSGVPAAGAQRACRQERQQMAGAPADPRCGGEPMAALRAMDWRAARSSQRRLAGRGDPPGQQADAVGHSPRRAPRATPHGHGPPSPVGPSVSGTRIPIDIKNRFRSPAMGFEPCLISVG